MPGGPPPGPPCSSCTACNFPPPNLCAQDAFNSIGSFPGALINDLRQQVRTEGRWQPYMRFLSPHHLSVHNHLTLSAQYLTIGIPQQGAVWLPAHSHLFFIQYDPFPFLYVLRGRTARRRGR